MPIYEYECTKCRRIEEVLQKFSGKPLKKCRHCSGKLHKLVSQSTFRLKGNGWYVTDYADKSKAPLTATNESKTSASIDLSSETSDKKTAKKTAKKSTD